MTGPRKAQDSEEHIARSIPDGGSAEPTSENTLRLLALEMRTLWERDVFDRVHPHPILAVAESGEGKVVRCHPDLEEGRCRLAEQFSSKRGPIDRHRFETELHAILGPEASFSIEVALSFLIRPRQAAFHGGGGTVILHSEAAMPEGDALRRPEAWWEEGEWRDLLEGRLGPWAMAVSEGWPFAICHTPIASPEGAEAGVWTHPDHRGRGLAGMVVQKWAEIASQRFSVLFYSTGASNASSQAVARKLDLPFLGRIWQVWPGSEEA